MNPPPILTFNPIKVLFLPVQWRWSHSGTCTFNPIKVLFLQSMKQLGVKKQWHLSILSRFYFYSLHRKIAIVPVSLSILSRFYFYSPVSNARSLMTILSILSRFYFYHRIN